MKYIFLVGDGMSDEPVPAIGNKTPLEAADISNMDYLAERGIVGMCNSESGLVQKFRRGFGEAPRVKPSSNHRSPNELGGLSVLADPARA